MLHNILNVIVNFITPLGAFGVFLAEFLDGLFVFVPTTIIFLVAGFLFLKGPMSIALIKTLMLVVVLPASLGLVLGSFIFYIPSYIYGKTFLDRWGKWIGVSWNDIENMNTRFKKYELEDISIILARIALVPSVMVTVFCGIIHIPPKRYSIITFIGGFFKALSVALIGWSAGELYIQYADYIDRVEKLVLVLIVLILIAFFGYRKYGRKVV
jgi:membrane protein DedA with SNARE-associated domain